MQVGKRTSVNRNLLAQLFVVLLLGVAYQEMITPVRASITQKGLTWPTLSLSIVFFLTSLRFFIGAQLHLVDADLLAMKGYVWIYDFFIIVFEMIVLTFMGGLSSLEANEASWFKFPGLLILLYGIDVVWVFSQWALGRVFPSWRRRTVPWYWAIVNLGVIVLMLLLALLGVGWLSTAGLIVFLVANVAAFVLDVLRADYAGIV